METRKKYKSQPTVIICENTATVNSGEVELFFDNNAKNNISINTGKTGVVQQSYKNSETLTIKQSSDKYNNNPYVEFDAGDDGDMLSSDVINVNVNGVLHKNEPVISFTSGGKTIRGAGNPYLYDNTQPDNGKDYFVFYKKPNIIRGHINDEASTFTFYVNNEEVTVNVDSNGDWEYDCGDEVISTLEGMFYECSSLTSVDLSHLDTSNAISMLDMFNNCSDLTTVNLLNLNTAAVTDMSQVFYGCSSLESLDLSSFDTSNVTSMLKMFAGCSSLTSLDVSNFNTGNVTDMGEMFFDCSALTSLDVSNFNTENVTAMNYMFAYCENITSLNLLNFNTTKVKYMGNMFEGCENLTTLDLSSFNTQEVETIGEMFLSCSNLTYLNLSNFDTKKVSYYDYFVPNVSTLTIDYDSSKWNNDIVSEFSDVNWHDISQSE